MEYPTMPPSMSVSDMPTMPMMPSGDMVKNAIKEAMREVVKEEIDAAFKRYGYVESPG